MTDILDAFGCEHWAAIRLLSTESDQVRVQIAAITDLIAAGIVDVWPPMLTASGRDAARAIWQNPRDVDLVAVRRELEIGRLVRASGGQAECRVGTVNVPDGDHLIAADPVSVFDGIDADVVHVGVLPGTWVVNVAFNDCGDLGIRVAELNARHADAMVRVLSQEIGTIGVDSGQAGLFLDSLAGAWDESWYDRCIDVTCDSPRAGLVEGGIVAASGMGDGLYPVSVDTLDRPASAVSIRFL